LADISLLETIETEIIGKKYNTYCDL
jgi:hypothetical protein